MFDLKFSSLGHAKIKSDVSSENSADPYYQIFQTIKCALKKKNKNISVASQIGIMRKFTLQDQLFKYIL